MRLSGIKLSGFKSFVDATQLPLPSNLSAIVGPNGCGKSNLIDAVRWVLGESSIKTLRGQESEDVIFNGSKTRKPVGRASVELSFDNSDRQIQGPFAAYAEIGVRRELARDGQSQYFLNNRKCLKRDVTDLFLGTGLGGRNQYAIIEQGMVSRMIEARPDELRVWLEEAAGISKYKERKRETESRIRQTRENLARLDDLRGELSQRLDALRRQAAHAVRYKEFRQQERVLRASLLALRERALGLEAEQHEQAIQAAGGLLAERETGLEEAAQAQIASESGFRAQQLAFNAAQAAVHDAEARLARGEQQLAHARELAVLAERERDQLLKQLADLERREHGERRRLEAADQELASLEQESTAALTAEQRAEAEARSALARTGEAEQAWEAFQGASEQPLSRMEGERVRVQTLERAQHQTAERQKRLDGERRLLDVEPLRASLATLTTELEALGEEEAAAAAQVRRLEVEVQQWREQRSTLDGALHEIRAQLQAARGRLASLDTLQQAALRQDDAEYSAWLNEAGLAGVPRLAQAIEVEPGWEAAVEQVLGERLQAPLVEALAELSEALARAPRSGLTLVAGSASPQPGEGPSGSLADPLREAPAVVRGWLSAIRIAGSLDEALAGADTLGPGESLITAEAAWVGPGWVRIARREEARSGVLARAQQIKQLRGRVEAHQREVDEREQALAELRLRQQQAEQERREQLSGFEQLRSRHAQRQAFRLSQNVRLEQTQARHDAVQQELDALLATQTQQTRELEESRARLVDFEATAVKLREQRAGLQQALARARETLSRRQQEATRAAQARSQVQIRLAGRQTAQAGLQQTLHELQQAREQLVDDSQRKATEASERLAPIEALSQALQVEQAQRDRARDQLRAARLGQEAAEQAVTASAQARRLAEQQRDRARDALQEQKLAFENLRARREALGQQFVEVCRDDALEPEAVLAALTPEMHAEAVEEQLGQLQRRIERLGPINLAAIQDLEESATRERYLLDQHADLSGALSTLETAIRKIDADTKQRFQDTFQKVDDRFRSRFPKLFGGGEAYLELTGDDPLDAGVRVMARPPGKRNSSISMLSGGEKAMTAVALLLALFELNPAPFCLMDEVDAPLDDANVGRFCEVVREMSASVQFIIITHNKITMELASQLLGVTMQEPGVSRLVSVDVEQAVTLANATPSTTRATA